MSSTTQSPNWREVISARSDITGRQEYLTSRNGALNVNASLSGTAAFNLTQVGGSPISLGQGTMANSFPITIASDNTGPVRVWDGTNIASVLKSDGTAAGQNAQIAAGSYLSAAFSTTIVAMVASTDVANYTWVSVQQTSQGTSSLITFQVSNDNVNWVAQTLISSTSIGGNTQTTSGAVGLYQGPLMGRYFRLNVTGISAGTTAGTVMFWSGTRQYNSMSVAASQSGTWTVGANSATGAAVPANAFYMGLNGGGSLTGVAGSSDNADGVAESSTANRMLVVARNTVYNGTSWDRMRSSSATLNSTGTGLSGNLIGQLDDVSPTAITENNFGNVRMSADRSLLTTTQNSYSHISTATTTTVKSGAGTLRSVTVNSLGTVASSTTIYDNTAGSGTVIAVINTLALSGTFEYNIQFTTGLTFVTTGTVAPDITVSYK